MLHYSQKAKRLSRNISSSHIPDLEVK